MKLPPISRRNLLISSGLAGAALFLPSLGPRRARGQAAAPIKRLVIMISEHGTVRNQWRMRRSHTSLGDWEYPFDDSDPMSFSEILRPLHPNRKDLLVLDGLAQISTAADKNNKNNHNGGHLHLLTGANMLDDNNAGGASIDQMIAKRIARPDRIPSLELATSANLFLGGFVNSGPSMRVPVEADPHALFQRLFPSDFNTMHTPTERDLINSARGSVLDLVQNEYAMVSPKLSADDKAKLDMHRQQIRDLETRLGSLANLNCSAPTAPGMVKDKPGITRVMSDMVAAAFACDLTRVATIAVTQLDNAEFNAPPGDVHQDFAHRTDLDPNAAKYMTQYNQVHAQLFNYLIDSLKKYPDGSGTLLDNTAAIWLTELATGPHALEEIPVVMAGSCAGAFKTGRYVAYVQDKPNVTPYPSDTTPPTGPAHTSLLISLLNAFGINQDTLGVTVAKTTAQPGKNIPSVDVPISGALARLS
jgi:hypothetical protein